MSSMLTSINQYGSESILENLQIALKEQLSEDDSDEDEKITWRTMARDIKTHGRNFRSAKSLTDIHQLDEEDEESHGHCSCDDEDEEQFTKLKKYNTEI